MADPKHPRLILRDFLSLNQCKELEFIHKSCSTVGYRPNVFSTTLSHLIATNSAHLILPFVPIRESLKEKVEEYFGCEYELCIEFTGLISWTRGSSIGWHSDDNRPYLKQRSFAAVCYLSSHGEDFRGGLFHFQDGEPSTIVPMAGDVVLYTADIRNIHSVDEITDGERLTLTLWFSRDSSYDEDAKLLALLSQSLLTRLDNGTGSYLPLPASSNMYWFPPNQAPNGESGFNACCARIYILGYDLYSSNDETSTSASDSSHDFSELLMERIQLARGDELFGKEFINVLQALQVLQFYHWRASEVQTSDVETKIGNAVTLTQSHLERIKKLKLEFLKGAELAEAVLGRVATNKVEEHHSHDWAGLSVAIAEWEIYSDNLRKEMLTSLPHWMTHQSLFSVPSRSVMEGS